MAFFGSARLDWKPSTEASVTCPGSLFCQQGTLSSLPCGLVFHEHLYLQGFSTWPLSPAGQPGLPFTWLPKGEKTGQLEPIAYTMSLLSHSFGQTKPQGYPRWALSFKERCVREVVTISFLLHTSSPIVSISTWYFCQYHYITVFTEWASRPNLSGFESQLHYLPTL
jgi:hypothetical protein